MRGGYRLVLLPGRARLAVSALSLQSFMCCFVSGFGAVKHRPRMPNATTRRFGENLSLQRPHLN